MDEKALEAERNDPRLELCRFGEKHRYNRIPDSILDLCRQKKITPADAMVWGDVLAACKKNGSPVCHWSKKKIAYYLGMTPKGVREAIHRLEKNNAMHDHKITKDMHELYPLINGVGIGGWDPRKAEWNLALDRLEPIVPPLEPIVLPLEPIVPTCEPTVAHSEVYTEISSEVSSGSGDHPKPHQNGAASSGVKDKEEIPARKDTIITSPTGIPTSPSESTCQPASQDDYIELDEETLRGMTVQAASPSEGVATSSTKPQQTFVPPASLPAVLPVKVEPVDWATKNYYRMGVYLLFGKTAMIPEVATVCDASPDEIDIAAFNAVRDSKDLVATPHAVGNDATPVAQWTPQEWKGWLWDRLSGIRAAHGVAITMPNWSRLGKVVKTARSKHSAENLFKIWNFLFENSGLIRGRLKNFTPAWDEGTVDFNSKNPVMAMAAEMSNWTEDQLGAAQADLDRTEKWRENERKKIGFISHNNQPITDDWDPRDTAEQEDEKDRKAAERIEAARGIKHDPNAAEVFQPCQRRREKCVNQPV